MSKDEKKAKKKSLIYCRISTHSQEVEGHGLQSQETRCRQYAAQKGYEVAGVFPDTVSGGGDFMKRAGMVALLSFLDAQPDENFIVIFDDLKRFARDVEFHLKLREAFRQRGAQIECLNFRLGDSPEDEFIETIMAAQGALERKQNGRQVAQKMEARMQSGYWVHAAPLGYRYKAVKGRGKMLFQVEPFASIIHEAFDGYATGRFGSQAEVKRFFESQPAFPRNKNGVVTQQKVTELLTNPIYTGHIVSERYGIHWLKGHHEAIVSLDTFNKVQELRQRGAKAPKRKNIGDDFALRGMVTCCECNVPLRSSWSTGKYQRHPYYLCQTKGCSAYGKSIRRDKIEGEVGDLLKELQPTDQLITLARAMFKKAWDARVDLAKTAVHSAKKQIGDLDKQIEGLLMRVLDSTNQTVIRTYEDKISQLEFRKARLVDQMGNQVKPSGTFEEKLEPVLSFLANPWKLWESGSTPLRRTVLKLAFADRIPYCRNEGPRTPDIALPFRALGGISDQQLRFGAGGGTRTHTALRPSDFKSDMSTIPSRPR